MLARFLASLRGFLNGKRAALLYTALACLTVSLSLEQYAIPLFILWILFVLLLDPSFLNVFLPVTLLCGFAIRTSGQSTILLKHVWLAFPVVLVIAVHFILYGKRARGYRFLWPQIAVSVALLLGGVFRISYADYFKPDALYYVFFLGVGMLFFYFWFRSGVYSNEYYEVGEKLMECLWFLGAFCAYSILDQALRLFLVLQSPFGSYVWSNDICELMLFCIPAAFYYARKRYFHVFIGLAFYGVMIFTQSYSALIMGFLLTLLCFFYLLKYRKSLRILTGTLLALLCLSALGAFLWLVQRSGGVSSLLASEENGRLLLIQNAWQSFLSSPIFGVGVGAPGVGDTTFMTVSWTHNLLFQVLGSMGVVGLFAYGYQLYARGALVLRTPSPMRLACGLSYLGLFLVSMLQPGEFCPMPYAMMAVMIFSVLESLDEEEHLKSKNDEKTPLSS